MHYICMYVRRFMNSSQRSECCITKFVIGTQWVNWDDNKYGQCYGRCKTKCKSLMSSSANNNAKKVAGCRKRQPEAMFLG